MGRGRDFASRWAERIFTCDPGVEVARSHYADQKKRIAEVAVTLVLALAGHNDAIYGELLGLDTARLAELRARRSDRK